MRRGKPTVHKAFDEATAVLAGDSLHALAFEVVADEATHPDPFIRIRTHDGAVEGGRRLGHGRRADDDIAAESETFDLPTVTRLQQLKTGALISFCLEAGAIMGRVPPDSRGRLRAYARDVGLAFQIADDLIDAEGDPEIAGKAVGKDAAAGKATFVSLLGSIGRGSRRGCSSIRRSAISRISARGGPAPCGGALCRREGQLMTRIGCLSRNLRSGHAGPYGYHPARRRSSSTGWCRRHHQSFQSPMFSVEERVETVRREVAGDGRARSMSSPSIRC